MPDTPEEIARTTIDTQLAAAGCLQREMLIRPQIIDPQLLRPRLLAREEHVRLDALEANRGTGSHDSPNPLKESDLQDFVKCYFGGRLRLPRRPEKRPGRRRALHHKKYAAELRQKLQVFRGVTGTMTVVAKLLERTPAN